MPGRKIQRCLHAKRTPCRSCHRSSVSRLHKAKTAPSPNTLGRGAESSVRHSFLGLVRHLNAPLAPLVSVTTGRLHPEFPQTMLAFNLLTSRQLDRLARHFHQTWPPTHASWQYPTLMSPWIGTPEERDTTLYTKRMRFGSFIGLRDCDISDIQHRNNYRARIRVSDLDIGTSHALQLLGEDWPKMYGKKIDSSKSA